MNPQISTTGEIKGRGSNKYKWVSGLTDPEREAVRRGDTVLVKDSSGHHMATAYKQVTHYKGKYGHRNYYGEVEA